MIGRQYVLLEVHFESTESQAEGKQIIHLYQFIVTLLRDAS